MKSKAFFQICYYSVYNLTDEKEDKSPSRQTSNKAAKKN